jgi:hypothetical protein
VVNHRGDGLSPLGANQRASLSDDLRTAVPSPKAMPTTATVMIKQRRQREHAVEGDRGAEA